MIWDAMQLFGDRKFKVFTHPALPPRDKRGQRYVVVTDVQGRPLESGATEQQAAGLLMHPDVLSVFKSERR